MTQQKPSLPLSPRAQRVGNYQPATALYVWCVPWHVSGGFSRCFLPAAPVSLGWVVLTVFVLLAAPFAARSVARPGLPGLGRVWGKAGRISRRMQWTCQAPSPNTTRPRSMAQDGAVGGLASRADDVVDLASRCG